MITGRCRTCIFWDQSEDDPTDGMCRRAAPRIVANGEQDVNGNDTVIEGFWPYTKSYDWCGEHQPT